MSKSKKVMVFGIGSFAQSVLRVAKDYGAEAFAYLTRDYGHYGPSIEGQTFHHREYSNPVPLIQDKEIDLIVPMSIDWARQPWTEELLALGVPVFSPFGEAMNIERDRDESRRLCQQYDIPFPQSYVAQSHEEAESIVKEDPRPFVIKNPLCSPSSPVHTIVCESPEDTLQWLPRLDYSEGVFLQEYVGRAEAGHIALVSNGEICSIVTNQEYKRAFNANMGLVAGAPLGGIVERDPNDRYGLARELLHPLLPWFRDTKFSGPIQVTAAKHQGRWVVLEYNVRMGVTCTQLVLRLLKNPLEVLSQVSKNETVQPIFTDDQFGATLTIAGYGYPYTNLEGPRLPVRVHGEVNCDLWWNETEKDESGLVMSGHRIADLAATSKDLPVAIQKIYENAKKVQCLASYYRTDIGDSLWPPGNSD